MVAVAAFRVAWVGVGEMGAGVGGGGGGGGGGGCAFNEALRSRSISSSRASCGEDLDYGRSHSISLRQRHLRGEWLLRWRSPVLQDGA